MDWKALDTARRKPRPFSPGTGLFWSDPYLASHVVWAHLDDRTDDASRTLARIEKEVAWINSLLPQPGRLLDLGCGVGRHAQLLAEKGWNVTGVDASVPSIEFARQEAQDASLSIDFRVGDIRSARLPQNQDIILVAYGTLATFSPAELRRLIDRCRRALAPRGVLVFDVFRQSWWKKQLLTAQKGLPWDVVTDEGFWSQEPHLVLTRTDAYPVLRTFGRTFVVVETDRVRRFCLWYRWYDRSHIQDEIVPGARVDWFGGLDGRRLTSSSPWIAVAARWEE